MAKKWTNPLTAVPCSEGQHAFNEAMAMQRKLRVTLAALDQAVEDSRRLREESRALRSRVDAYLALCS